MNSPALPAGVSSTSSRFPSASKALELRRLELQHQERLAAIEAEKAEAIARYKAQQARSVEELRQKTKELEAQSALKLEEEKRKYAALLAEKEKTLKAMETNASLQHDRTQKEIAALAAKSSVEVTQLQGRYETDIAKIRAQLSQRRSWFIVGTIFALLLALFLFYRYRKRERDSERKAQREHEAEMLEQRMRHQHIEKILEIIADSETSPEVKVELSRLLQSGIASADDPKLLEYRKRGENPSKPDDQTPSAKDQS